MSIEFGILRDGSTITLIGTQRVDLDDDIFDDLDPMWRKIEARTGHKIDKYGSATFNGHSLDIFMEEVIATKANGTEKLCRTLAELLRVAKFAKDCQRELTYFGE